MREGAESRRVRAARLAEQRAAKLVITNRRDLAMDALGVRDGAVGGRMGADGGRWREMLQRRTGRARQAAAMVSDWKQHRVPPSTRTGRPEYESHLQPVAFCLACFPVAAWSRLACLGTKLKWRLRPPAALPDFLSSLLFSNPSSNHNKEHYSRHPPIMAVF